MNSSIRQWSMPAAGLCTALFASTFFGGVPTAAALGPNNTVPVLTDYFDTGPFSTLPTGITYNTTADLFAILDGAEAEVFLTNRFGISQGQFDTAAFGATDPQGITFIPDAADGDKYAIVDEIALEVVVTDAAGVFERQCAIGAFSTSPNGIAYIPTTGHVAIVDDSADEVFIADIDVVSGDPCQFVSSFDTNLGGLGSTRPTGIAFLADNGNFAVVDSSADEVFVFDGTGTLVDNFASGFVSTNPAGIVFVSSLGKFTIVDASADEVFCLNAEGTLVNQFSTLDVFSSNPIGVTNTGIPGQFALLDRLGLAIILFDSSGNFVDQCGISLFSPRPEGITFNPTDGSFAVVDSTADELFIVDAGCNKIEQFDLATFGIGSTNPTGVTFDPATGNYVVVDGTSDAALVIDPARPGRLNGQFSAGALGSGAPTGAAFVPSAATVAVSSLAGVFVADRSGVLRGRFDTNEFAPTTNRPRGIAFDPGTETFAIVDNLTQEVYLLDLPALLVPADTGDEVCAGDVDNDGDVDRRDAAILSQDFGRTNCRVQWTKSVVDGL